MSEGLHTDKTKNDENHIFHR